MKVLSKSFPRLKGKAANTMLVLSWLIAWASTTHGTDISSDEVMQRTFVWWTWNQLFHNLKSAESRNMLTFDEATRAHRLGYTALQGYSQLATAAVTQHKPRCSLVPKLHITKHVLDDMMLTLRNPMERWCYADETVMGQLCRIASRCHLSCLGGRVLIRWAI